MQLRRWGIVAILLACAATAFADAKKPVRADPPRCKATAECAAPLECIESKCRQRCSAANVGKRGNCAADHACVKDGNAYVCNPTSDEIM